MARREKVFLTQLRDSFRNFGAFFYKIPDTGGSEVRFQIKKPFDAFVVLRGTPIAIEAKFQREYKAFGIKQLKDHQIEALEEFSRHGESYVMLNIKHQGDREKGLKRMNRLLIFYWEYFKQKETYKKAELLECFYVEAKGGVFDLSKWFPLF